MLKEIKLTVSECTVKDEGLNKHSSVRLSMSSTTKTNLLSQTKNGDFRIESLPWADIAYKCLISVM
ncbi:MAG: hypothetical protein IPQ18_14575 [Saprospiraceae bacterium]|nr:hypothetical protein [Saprospiraceae bacterium]